MIPALSQVCSLQSPFAQDIADYAAGRCEAIELWLTKLEAYLESHSTGEVKDLLVQHSLTAPVASFQGGLLDSQGERRRESWQLLQRRLQLCSELGIGTLVVACDVSGSLSQQDIERVQASLSELAAKAGQHGVRAAIEFQARATLGNNIQTAALLVGEVSSPHLGICLDAWHYFVGPSQPEDLGLLTPENLFHVQLCDLAGVPRELATDSDRILPGDGDIPLVPIIEHLKAIGYAGHVSIEVMNPQIWSAGPLHFGEIGMTALRVLLGEAEK